MDTSEIDQSDRALGSSVRLDVPAEPQFVQVARLTGSALASRAGFSIDEVDDLRIAIDELSAVLVGVGGADSRLELEFHLQPDGLEVEGWVPSTAIAALSELSSQILNVVVDRYQLDSGDGKVSFRLRKGRREAAPDA